MVLRIRELREAAQMKQKDLAAKMGVSCPAVNKWECGGAMPKAEKLPELASALCCTIDDLFSPSSIIPCKEA